MDRLPIWRRSILAIVLLASASVALSGVSLQSAASGPAHHTLAGGGGPIWPPAI